MKPEPTPARDLLVVFGALLLTLGLLFARRAGVPVPGPVRELLAFGLPVLGAAALAGRGALDLLGLTRFSGRGVAVMLVGSLAMLAGLALTADGAPTFDASALWRGAIRPALVEESLFRGLAFGVLYWRTGWSLPAAMLTTGAIFGSFHLPGAILGGHLDQAWGAVLVTSAGGCWFAWLYSRWDRSLWVPVAAHASMNAWWVLYTAGPTAGGGGPGATWGRVAAIAIITFLTLRATEPDDAQS